MSKTILITGATSGFGKACAELFAHEGWQLILCGRREERLTALRSQLDDTACHLASFDVQDREQIRTMYDNLPEEFKKVDVLVNNAGLALGLNPAHKADMADWETMVNTNIKGLLYMTRMFLPDMVDRDEGHVINIGSVAGNWPYPGGNTYGATKAFVQQFSRNLRADLLGKNVRVTNIEPGIAETEFSLVRFHGDGEKADSVYEGVQPLTAVDIAETVFWSVSRPPHVNINSIEIMALNQSWGPMAIKKEASEKEAGNHSASGQETAAENVGKAFFKKLFSKGDKSKI